MAMKVSWHSQAGTRTDDNRDCGGIGIKDDEALCIVVDGSTTAQDSGDLARQIVREMVDWYVSSDETTTDDRLTAQLMVIHETWSPQYPRASASYMILHVRSNKLLVLHAGDCLLGLRDGGIEWMTQPHTLANAIAHVPIATLAGLTTRHRLTRSFRAREFHVPDAMELNIDKELVVATDGFWAELGKQDQARFLEGQKITIPDDGDDCSALRILLHDAEPGKGVQYDEKSTDGFYAKRRS